MRRHRMCDGILSEKEESEVQQKRDDKDKKKNVACMLQCGQYDTSVFTVTVFLFAEPFNQKAFSVFRLPGFPAGKNMAESVNQKAAQNSDQHLQKHDFQDSHGRNGF